MSELDVARGLTLERDADAADRIEPWDRGVAIISPSMPRLWDANYLRVDERAGLGARDLAERAERTLSAGGAFHRAIVVPDGEAGETLRPDFAGLGWNCDRLLFMVLRGTPRRRPGAPDVEEIGIPEREALKRDFAAGVSDEEVEIAREVAIRDERLARRWRIRHFGARDRGRLAASCSLVLRDAVAEIDDVSTLHAHRGRGLARAALVTAVATARAAGAETVFLGAYRDDWPHRWYSRLGFETVGMLTRFRRLGSIG